MFLEKLVFVSGVISLITLLSYRFNKKHNINNLIVIAVLSVCLGIYLPFVIYDIFIPNILQIIIFIAGILIPSIYTLIQYNDIKLLKKILYYNLKKSYKNKDYDKTMELLKKVIYIDGYTSEYAVLLGNCKKGKNELIEAQECYESAISLDNSNPNAHFELGGIYEKFEQKDRALEMYTKAIKIKPDYYEAYEALAIHLTRRGKFKAAIDIYKRAVLIFPTSFEMLYNLAMLESEVGDYNVAITNFEKVIAIKPDLYSVYFSLGKLYHSKKEYEKSINAYKKILNTTVYGSRAYYSLAIVYAECGDYERSMSSLEYAMELDPHYIKEVDREYSFNPMREMINNYKIQKEKSNMKDYSKRTFKDKGFRLLNLNDIETNKNVVKEAKEVTEVNKQNGSNNIENKEEEKQISKIQNHA